MPRGGWRYIAQRLTGDGSHGDFLDFDVPLQGVSLTDTLSGFNALSGTISPRVARMVAPDGSPLFDEWGTAIWAENSGQIRGGGILTHSGFNGPEWSLECTGYAGYLEGLPYTDSWFGVEVDPLDVMRKIWSHVQAQPGGNIAFEIDQRKTGLKIGTELEQVEFDTQSGPVSFESGPIKLTWYGTPNLADVANQLASNTPFDWHERHYWDGDIIRHKLDFGFPSMGTKRTDLKFVVGENVAIMPDVNRAGEDYASEALVLGAGEGAAMVRGASSRPTKRLRRVAVVEDSSLRSLRAANSRAAEEVTWRAALDTISGIAVRDTKMAPVGSVNVGDQILIEGRLDWTTLETWARVTSVTLSPEDGNVMSLAVAQSDRLVA